MSVATACAVLRVRLTTTICRALPRVTAANAQAQPTLPVPMMPSFMAQLSAGLAGNARRDDGVPDAQPVPRMEQSAMRHTQATDTAREFGFVSRALRVRMISCDKKRSFAHLCGRA